MTMHEFHAKAREESLDSMRRIVGQTVEDDQGDMTRALEYALKHGSSREKAEAIRAYTHYSWALAEQAAHALAPAAAK